jgi:hypothetical protein
MLLMRSEHIATHDTFQDTVAAIALKLMYKKKFLTFSLTTYED